MASSSQRASRLKANLLSEYPAEVLLDGLQPDHSPLPARVPGAGRVDSEAIRRRWAGLPSTSQEVLWNGGDLAAYGRHIENVIGEVRVPVGVAGPLRVNGSAAHGDYWVPLATTEAALVASLARGCQVISESGGCAALILAEGVSRAPGFVFANLQEAGEFASWVIGRQEDFARAAEATTRHGTFQEMRISVEGNHVYLILEYQTGDAAGQNMVTIATQAVCDFIRGHSPVKPVHAFVESNLSGDKKASAQSFQSVRGRKVTSDVLIPQDVIAKRLHTTAGAMTVYWRMSAIGGVLSGTIGVQGHYANPLAALFLATGQDVACVSEAAVGVTRFEERPDGALYAAVTLPNVIAGTVGGGTVLPGQSACLDVLGLRGTGKARAYAEVATALALAGELSIIGALAAGDFTRAHRKLARGERES